MDSKAFNKLYFDKDNPKIKTITNKNGETEGVDTLQTGEQLSIGVLIHFYCLNTEQKKYWQGNTTIIIGMCTAIGQKTRHGKNIKRILNLASTDRG